ILVEGKSWKLTPPDGKSYVLELNEAGNKIHVSRHMINAVSAAASVAAGIGLGAAGIAVSGAGAVSQNVVLSKTNAFAEDSVLESYDDVTLESASTAKISSTVLAASVALGGGGAAGVGASIGVAVAQNFIGWTPVGGEVPAEVQAYLEGTSVDAGGALALNSTATQSIGSVVVSGSAAVAIGGAAGIGGAGSGVWAENKIGVDVGSYIDGEGEGGIAADSVTLTAKDNSSIKSLAAAASLAASAGGAAGVSVSIGVSLARNTITSDVEAYINNADGSSSSTTDYGINAGTGGVTIRATENASIQAVSAAASLGGGFAGVAGVSISGAGADAHNVILTDTNAYIAGSAVDSGGLVDIDAANTAHVDATVVSAAASVAVGGIAGIGGSIGIAVARNAIGWDADDNYTANYATADNPESIETGDTVKTSAGTYEYIGTTPLSGTTDNWLTTLSYSDASKWRLVHLLATGDNPSEINTGDMVRISAGANAGNVYKYIGSDTLSRPDGPAPDGETTKQKAARQQEEANWLTRLDYADLFQWRLVSLKEDPAAVHAYVLNSSVDSTGALTLDAVSDQSIDATIVSGSVAVSGGLAGVAVSGAGASAANRIATLVQASIEGDKDGRGVEAFSVFVNAEDISKIKALTGAVAVAASAGLAGVSLSIGIGAAYNQVDNDIAAFIKDVDAGASSTVGDVSLMASEDATIDATTGAASAAAALGGVAASLSGAGALATNIILGGVNASIDNSVVDSAANVLLEAENSSKIDAEVAAGAAASSSGAFVGVGVSIGAAIARNIIGHAPNGESSPVQVHASITNSSIGATEELKLTATSTQIIDATVEASSVAASGGGFAGIGLSGAGASARNRVSADVQAFIDGDQPTTVSTAGITAASLTLAAEDDSTITAFVGSASMALVVGAVGSSLSVGLALAQNEIANNVEAYIRNIDQADRLEATGIGGIIITADEASAITSTATAASEAAGVGIAISGAGAEATNAILNSIQAYVDTSDLGSAGDIVIDASDTATIGSFAGAVSASSGAGLGGSAAYNEIANIVQARVLNSAMTTSQGSISVEAYASGTIQAIAASGAEGLAVGVAGTIAIQTIGNTVQALVENSTLAAADTVLVLGRWDGDITADGGTASLGGCLGIGGTIVLNTLANGVSALINRSAVTAGGNGAGRTVPHWHQPANEAGWQDDRLVGTNETFHGVAVVADSVETLRSAFATASIGAGGLAVNKAVNLVADTTEAGITDSHIAEGPDGTAGVAVRAHQATNVTNLGGVAGASGLGAVGGFDTTIVNNLTQAFIASTANDYRTVQAGNGGVDVSAWSQQLVSSETGSAAANAIGAAGAVSAVDVVADTEAYIKHVQLTTSGSLTVEATRIADVETKAGAVSLSLLAGAGGSVDFVTIAGTTEAYLSATAADVTGDTSILATSHALITGQSGTAGAGGIASIVGAASIHLIETVTRAYLDAAGSGCTLNQTTVPDQDVTLRAIDRAEIASSAGSLAASLLVGVGGSIDVNVIRNSAEAEVGDGVWLQAGGSVTVDAQATQQVSSYAKGFAIGLLTGIGGSISAIGLGGGLGEDAHDQADQASGTINDLLFLSGGIAGLTGDETSQRVESILSQHSLSIDNTIATVPHAVGSVRAAVGAQAHVAAGGDITILAKSTQAATSQCGQYTGGIVAVGGSLATLDLSAPVSAVVGDHANLAAAGDVTIEAESSPALTLDVQTGDSSAMVGVGAARVVVDLDLSTQATVGDSAMVDAGAALEISALTVLDDAWAVAEGSVGGMIAVGEVEVSGQAALETLATIGLQAKVTSSDDAAVLARSEFTNLYVEATGGAGGLAGAGGAWAEFHFTKLDTEVLLSGWSSLVAGGDVQLSAASLVDLSAYVSQDVGAVAAGASVQAEVGTVMLTTVTVDDGAMVSAQTVAITASADKIRGHATADCDVKGLAAGVVSTTRVWYVVTNTVWIDWKATVAGRDAVNILARAGNLDAVTSSTIDCGGFSADVTVEGYDHVDVNTLVHLTGGAQLKTPRLIIGSDPVFGTQTYNQDAGAIHASGVLSNVTYDALPDWTHDSRIEFYGDAVYVPVLSLHVDQVGNVDTSGGIAAHMNDAGEIEVDGFLYSGGAQPAAHLAAVGGAVVGTGRFLSGAAGDCRIVNESDYALRLGSVFAGAALDPINWFVEAADDISEFHYTNGASDSSGAIQLHVDSVGDVRLDGAISLPHGIVDIRTAGDIEDVLDVGSMMMEAWYTHLSAGGGIGSEAKPIHVASKDHSFFLLEASAGQDAWLSVSAQFSDPSTNSVLLYLGDLSAGGVMNLDYVGAQRPTGAGAWEAIDTAIQLSGPAQAGGDFNLTQWSGGVLQVYQPVTAEGNVTLESNGGIYLHERITAGLAATVHATNEIGGSPYQRITAHDIDLNGIAVGGVGDATLKIDLTGGALTAVAQTDIGIRGVGGPMTVAYVGCGEGGARLEVADTGRDDDDIVFGIDATMTVATVATLTAGDHLLLDSTARAIAGEVVLNLDAAAVDPDPGRGVEWTFQPLNFVPQVSHGTKVNVVVNTGVDNDSLAVASTMSYQPLHIHTGAGNDTLTLGVEGSIVDFWGAIAYDGGAGQDLLLLDDSSDTAGRGFDLSQLTSDALGLWGPAVTERGTQYGAWYENVETLDLRLGSGGDFVGIDASGTDVQQVLIDGRAGSDRFEVGSGTEFLLSDIHGQLRFTGGTNTEDWDVLNIVENNSDPGVRYFSAQLTPDLFVGEGLDGLHYTEFESLKLELGSQDKSLTITGLTTPADVDLGAGDNHLTLGTPDVPFATAFERGLGVECGEGNNVVELYDTAGTAAAQWGMDDTKITYALPPAESLIAEVTGRFDQVVLHLGQGGSNVWSSIQGNTDVALLGGPGSDWLLAREVPSGHILFHGAGATDHVVIDNRDRTEDRALSLDGPPLTVPGVLAADARISKPGSSGGIVYDAEQVEIYGGSGDDIYTVMATASTTDVLEIDTGAGADTIEIAATAGGAREIWIDAGDGDDTVQVAATAAATEKVFIRSDTGQDKIRVGSAETLLSAIHGLVDVSGADAEDALAIYSGNQAGTVFEGRLNRTALTGLGLDGSILFDKLGQLGVFLGAADERLIVTSLPDLTNSLAQINMGAGDDRLTLGGAEDVWGADLSRLAGFTLGITGGEGNDVLVLDDYHSTVARRGVLIADLSVQNIGLAEATTNDFESLKVRLNDLGNEVTVWKMARPVTIESGAGDDTFNIHSMAAVPEWPLVIQAGSGNDRLNLGDSSPGHHTIDAPIFFYGGAGNEQVSVYDLNDGGRLEAYGEEGSDSYYVDHMSGGQVIFDGGDGADVLQVGWTAEFHNIAGDIGFYGQAGDDRGAVYQLSSDGSLLFDAGAGDDELALGRTDGEAARLEFLDGPVIFKGGAGEDSFDIDGRSGGSGTGIVTLTKAVPNAGSEAMAWASWDTAAGGLFWTAEHGTMTLGGTSNSVHVQATAPECATLDIAAYGDSDFYLEAQGSTTLDDLHGDITLIDPEYNDTFHIDNRASANPLRAQLNDSRFQILDASGVPQANIIYTGFDGMDVSLGDASDELTVGSLSAYASPVVFSLGGGSDLLELGREGALSRLSAIRSDVIVYGEGGRDTVAFYDADNSGTRSVAFSGLTISGLLPTGLGVQLGYVEQINAYLGTAKDYLTITDPGWDLRVDTGGGDDRITVNEEAPERHVQLLGGLGNDALYMGNGLAGNQGGVVPTAPSGTVEFRGGAGNDAAYAYRSPSEALFNFYGEGGDDTLEAGIVQAPGTDPTKCMLGLLDGAVCFYGGDGYDTLELKQTINGNVVAQFDRSTTPNGDEMAHFGLDMNLGSPDSSYMGMDHGVWYDADFVSMNMGNTYTSTDTTDVYIDATSPSTQLLQVQREGGTYKHFHVGANLNIPLSAIHGQLSLKGGNSLCEISEAGVNDGADTLTVSWSGDLGVGGYITSRWLGGINYQGTGDIRITPTDGADTITIQSLQKHPDSIVELVDIQSTDLAVLGQTVGSSQVTVSGVYPVFGMPTVAGSGSMTATEGSILNVPVSILNLSAGHSLASLTTDHGSLIENAGAYTWQYRAARLETIAFTAVDSAGIRVQKLFDLEAQNEPPVAADDAYSIREQKMLLGNVLENDTCLAPQPAARLVASCGHGTLTFQPDGSFSYISVAGFLGDDTFTYQVNDGLVDSEVATVTIHVTANQAPIAQDDTLEKRLFLSITSQELLANDSDADGAPLTVAILSQPEYGELIPNGDGTFHYVPALYHEALSVHFTYSAFDGLAYSAPATVTLEPLYDERPAANDDFIGTVTDTARVITAIELTANDADADGDAMQVIIKGQPEHGTLSPDGNGSWVYLPDAGFVGVDSFGYAATDGMKESEAAMVSIRVADLLPAHTLAVNSEMSSPRGSLAGRSWAYAYRSLQDALDRAEMLNTDAYANNDISTIWVTGATYAPSRPLDVNQVQSTTFSLISHVTIVGGFEGVESLPGERPVDEYTGAFVYETVLSGDFQFDDPDAGVHEFNNSWTVVHAHGVEDAALDSLTITGAYGWDGISFDQVDRWLGGGLHLTSSAVTLRNVRVKDNFAAGGGAGIYQEGGVLRLDHVTVEGNSGWGAGGGLQHLGGDVIITDSVFQSNKATASEEGPLGGGGMYLTGGMATLVNVTVGGGSGVQPAVEGDSSEEGGGGGNYSGEAGGGIKVVGPISVRGTNVIVRGNEADGPGNEGGGLYLTGTGANVVLANALVADNMYGGVCNDGGTLTLQNSTIARNVSSGGIFSSPGSTTTLINAVVDENWDGSFGNEDATGVFSSSSTANLIGVAAGGTTGLVNGVNGNHVGTPEAPISAGMDDAFHLNAGSPAASAGDISLLPQDVDDLDGDGNVVERLPLDLDGNARIRDGLLDLGAFSTIAPFAGDDWYTVAMNETLTVDAPGVLANDIDPYSNSPYPVLMYYDPYYGQVELNSDGSFVFTPQADYQGLVRFTYQFYDDAGSCSNEATVTITVTEPNTVPVAVDDAYTTAEDTPLTIAAAGFLANDSDADGNNITAALVSNPTHGTLIMSTDGAFTYTPAADFNGSDRFTYKANDGTAESNVATVSLTFTPVNDAPVGTGTTVTTLEDTPYIFAASDFGFTDPKDNGANALLSVKITTLPWAGTLALSESGSSMEVTAGQPISVADLTAGNLVFTPALNANGTGYTNFTFQVQDDGGTANGGLDLDPTPKTMTVNVTPVNDAPAVTDDGYTIKEDTPLVVPAGRGVLVNDTDVDSGILTAHLVSNPAHGTLSLSPDGRFAYTPVTGFHGADSFTYQANDGQADSNGATVNLTINAANAIPVARSASFNLAEDAVLSASAIATDANGDNITLSVAQGGGPTHGTLSFNPDGTFTYTPVADFNGSDRFTFKANDGKTDSNAATVSLTITPVSDAPFGTSTTVTTLEDTPYIFAELDFGFTDPKDSPANSLLAVRIVSLPGAGALNVNGVGVTAGQDVSLADLEAGNLIFTPAADAFGCPYASFTFQVQDDGGTGNGGVDLDPIARKMTVNVAPVNRPPVAVDDEAGTLSGMPVTLSVLSNDSDVDGDTLSISAFTQPGHGTVTDNGNGTLLYTPGAGFIGDDSFRYTVSDGKGGTGQAGVAVTVMPLQLIISAGTQAGDGSADTFRLVNKGDGIEVTVNDEVVFTTPFAIAPLLQFTGSKDADTLIVDFSAGSPIFSPGITYDGKTVKKADRLVLTGGSVSSETYTFTGSRSGMVVFDGSPLSYADVSSVTDTINIANRSFVFGSANDTISVGDDGILGNGISRITGLGNAVDFSNPTSSWTVNAGAGKDKVILKPLDPKIPVTFVVTVDGGAGNDTIDASAASFNITLFGGDGKDALKSGSGSDTLYGGAGDDTLSAGDGNDYLSGDGGNDKMYGGNGDDVLMGGPGNDLLDGGPGTNSTYDDALPTVTVTATDARASEAGPDPGMFVVTRSLTGGDFAVKLGWSGSATAGSDFSISVSGGDWNAASATLTLHDGSGSAALTMTPVDDSLIEGSENAVLTILSDRAYEIRSPGNASVAVADNDSPALPALAVSDVSVVEGKLNKNTKAEVTISLSAPSTQRVTVTLKTLDDTATGRVDYAAVAGATITFNPGVTKKTYSFIIKGDNLAEGNEQFFTQLTNSKNAMIADGTGIVAIVDDDAARLVATTSRDSTANLSSVAIIPVVPRAMSGWETSDFDGEVDTRVRDDTFTASSVFGELAGPGYRLWARFFDEVHAEARLGRDIANLSGTRDVDELDGMATGVRRSGPNAKSTFANSAKGFVEIQAFGGAGQDNAVLIDALIDQTTYGPPAHVLIEELAQILRMKGFEKIELWKTGTGEKTDIDNIDSVFARWE
ncbi:MAG: tandem-95 repeat protein, partial [Pirellulales bacterium]|nr:tandem-95 repeat protein [Pirellulales bacterium]